jgi:trk system potassium uptake protein
MSAARPRVVLKYLGQILLVTAALTAVPLAASLVLGEDGSRGRLLAVVAVLAALALPLSRLPTPRQIQWNEALAVTGLSFVAASLAMTWPLMGHGIPGLDAWFEAVSGVTTTGLSTLETSRARGALPVRPAPGCSGTEGLGIAVLSVALVMRHHASSKRLLESGGEEASRLRPARTLGACRGLSALTLCGGLLIWAPTATSSSPHPHPVGRLHRGFSASTTASRPCLGRPGGDPPGLHARCRRPSPSTGTHVREDRWVSLCGTRRCGHC